MKRSVLAALAGLALAAPASAAVVPSGWTIADAGPGWHDVRRTIRRRCRRAYLPSGLQPGRRLRVAYLLGGPGAGANRARALGIAAAADELLWQRTTPPFAVVVTSAGGRRTLAAAMRFAQQTLSPVGIARAEP